MRQNCFIILLWVCYWTNGPAALIFVSLCPVLKVNIDLIVIRVETVLVCWFDAALHWLQGGVPLLLGGPHTNDALPEFFHRLGMFLARDIFVVFVNNFRSLPIQFWQFSLNGSILCNHVCRFGSLTKLKLLFFNRFLLHKTRLAWITQTLHRFGLLSKGYEVLTVLLWVIEWTVIFISKSEEEFVLVVAMFAETHILRYEAFTTLPTHFERCLDGIDVTVNVGLCIFRQRLLELISVLDIVVHELVERYVETVTNFCLLDELILHRIDYCVHFLKLWYIRKVVAESNLLNIENLLFDLLLLGHNHGLCFSNSIFVTMLSLSDLWDRSYAIHRVLWNHRRPLLRSPPPHLRKLILIFQYLLSNAESGFV